MSADMCDMSVDHIGFSLCTADDSGPSEYQFGADAWLRVASDGSVRWRSVLVGRHPAIFAAVDQARVWADLELPMRGVLPGDFLLLPDDHETGVGGVEFMCMDGVVLGASPTRCYIAEMPYPTADDPSPEPVETVLSVGEFVGVLVHWAKIRVQ